MEVLLHRTEVSGLGNENREQVSRNQRTTVATRLNSLWHNLKLPPLSMSAMSLSWNREPFGFACVAFDDASFPGFPTFPVIHKIHYQHRILNEYEMDFCGQQEVWQKILKSVNVADTRFSGISSRMISSIRMEIRFSIRSIGMTMTLWLLTCC